MMLMTLMIVSLTKLNQTFITPIDREDIYALANGLDDGVDFLARYDSENGSLSYR